MPTFAVEFAGGMGALGDPYLIHTPQQLIFIGTEPNLLSKHFALVNDIDLNPILPGGRIFNRALIAPYDESAGNAKQEIPAIEFTGTFDGRGHSIRHLTIHSATNKCLGLFGRIGPKGKIHDIRLEGVEINSAGSHIGALVGYNRGHISECHVSGSVFGGTEEWISNVGLLAGRNWGTIINCNVDGSVLNDEVERGYGIGLITGTNWGTITGCRSTGMLTGGELFNEMGGIAGINLGSISDCYANNSTNVQSIYGGTGKYGGLVGSNKGIINRCYATGNVSCGRYSNYVGGLVGINTGTVTACYATGQVTGIHANWALGGLIGWNWGYVLHCFARGDVVAGGDAGGLVGDNWGSISHCYATGKAELINPKPYLRSGGLVGDKSSLPNLAFTSFWDIDTSGVLRSEGGSGLTTIEMQEPQSFIKAGWDWLSETTNGTSDIWKQTAPLQYPTLTLMDIKAKIHQLQGAGTAEEPYCIATIWDLGAVSHYDTRAHYKLVSDISLSSITWSCAAIPSFEGVFNGNGHKISNLAIHGGDHLGLFGTLGPKAVVKNLIIEDAEIIGHKSAQGLSILAAENWGLIQGCQVTGQIEGDSYQERLAGISAWNNGIIENCHSLDYAGPYTTIIRDPNATRFFLSFEGIEFDEIWIPEESNLQGLTGTLRSYLSNKIAGTYSWINNEYILANLSRYDREYSGFIHNDSKFIICNMIMFGGLEGGAFIPGKDTEQEFTIIFDGGCGVVRVIFDAETGTVVSIRCNGQA